MPKDVAAQKPRPGTSGCPGLDRASGPMLPPIRGYSDVMTSTPVADHPGRPRRRLVALGAGLVAATTAAGWVGAWLAPAGSVIGWLCDLTTHFRVYTALAAVAGLVVAFRHGGIAARLTLGTVAAIHAVELLPAWLPGATADAERRDGTVIDVVCLNVRYSNRDTERVLAYLRSTRADVVAVVEVDGVWADAIASLGGDYPFAHVKRGDSSEGIALLSRWPLRDAEVVDFGTRGMPSIVATVITPAAEITVIATHPWPPMGPALDRELRHHLREVGRRAAASESPCLVVGDLNATPWCEAFRGLVAAGRLRDSAAGRGIQNTWNARLWVPRIPIDHILVSPDVTVLDRRVGPDVGSDHFPVEARLVVPSRQRDGATSARSMPRRLSFL